MDELMEAEGETLSEEEKAFFDSGGEADLPEQPEAAGGEGEEAKPETPEGSEGKEAKKSQTIPFDVFHAEREEHKKTKAEMAELRDFKARMEEKLSIISQLQQSQQPAEDPDPEPDPEVNIFAHNAWLKRQVDRQQASIAEQQRAYQQAQEQAVRQQQEQQLQARIWGAWQESVGEYSKQNEDFNNAAQWLAETRDKQLQAMASVDNRFASKAGRDAQMNQELAGIVMAAVQKGMSPAEMVYQIAQSYGYAQGKMELPGNLKQIQANQAASRTIGQAAGNAGGDEITLETLDKMSEQEFSAWSSKPENARKFRQLMGG